MKHLTPEQFGECLLGSEKSEAARHIAECEMCRVEVERMRRALGGFRQGVHEWASRHPQPMIETARTWFVWWRYAAVTAMALTVVAAGLLLKQGRVEPSRTATMSDAALLEQIDAQVSRQVPRHMEPLVNLVAWEDAGKSTTEKEKGIRQ